MGLVVLRTMCSVGWERYNGWDRKKGHGKETALNGMDGWDCGWMAGVDMGDRKSVV